MEPLQLPNPNAQERKPQCAGTQTPMRRNANPNAQERKPQCAGTQTPMRRNAKPPARQCTGPQPQRGELIGMMWCNKVCKKQTPTRHLQRNTWQAVTRTFLDMSACVENAPLRTHSRARARGHAPWSHLRAHHS
eukprot:361170-Chlamydomonas_euryale.AAC.2